jgi:hypothetical protein
MLKLKSQLTCSYCSRIFKDPIELPCDENICHEHLSEKAIVKENKIKCNECKGEFQIKDNDFKSNKTLKKLIESQSYLSEQEICLKQELEETTRKFFELYDEYHQKKTKLESEVFEHFQEMRFQIDEHREKLKAKIDELALAMIDDTTKNAKLYLSSLLKETLLEDSSSFHVSKSLENELNQIEDTFRNPNLLIASIQEMQTKQEASLKDIQLKLNQMNQLKDNLKATNEFQPNLSFFNKKEETSVFGSIKFKGHCLNVNTLKSQILTDQHQSSALVKLCEFSPNDKWSLLYRGTRDGFGAADFHAKCDGHSNTLTIIKAAESSYIFGGFTTVSWESSVNGTYKRDPYAFIFSLTNNDNQTVKMKVNSQRHQFAIYCHFELGPIFGCDIRIGNNANITMDSLSRLGFAYNHPQYAHGSNEADTFLGGSYRLQLDEIEVYQKE